MADALQVLDARSVRRWFEHALRSLLAVREQVDVLNVFPVPDGDTGTNLVLTLAGAADAAAQLPADASLTRLTAGAARGALVNARGNSGVILSQAMRGLAHGVAGLDEVDGAAFARALTSAADGAREAVDRPVEGTILTVADAAARASRDVADQPLLAVVQAAVRAAVTALEDTRGQLPVLTEREVVDAGGAGFVILLGALESVVDGGGRLDETTTRRARETLAELWSEPRPALAGHGCSLGASVVGAGHDMTDPGGAFEVMYVVRAGEPAATELRARLDRAGDSVAVVGGVDDDGDGLWQVHVHTDDPAAVLADPSVMTQVCVRSLTAPALPVVACTRVPALAASLAQTGAGVCVHPDDAGLRRAVVDTGAPEVLLLPCDDDAAALATSVFASTAGPAEPAAPSFGARQQVHVLDSRDEAVVLGVVSELVAGTMAAEGDAADHRRTAVEALARSRGGACDAADAGDAVARLARPEDELLMVVTGARLATDTAGREDVLAEVTAALAQRAPSAEVIVLDGGQHRPDLLLGAQ